MDDSDRCQICCTRRWEYECRDCKYRACHSCLRKYVIQYANSQPHCPSCNVLYSIEELYEILGRTSFTKEYLPKAIELEISKQLQKIPEALPCATKLKTYARISAKMKNGPKQLIKSLILLNNCSRISFSANEQTDENKVEGRAIGQFFSNLLDEYKKMTVEQLAKCQAKVIQSWAPTLSMVSFGINIPNELKQQIQTKVREIFSDKLDLEVNDFAGIDTNFTFNTMNVISREWEKITNKKLGECTPGLYLFPCPTEGCKGYINDDFRCNLCRTTYCKHCLVNITKHPELHKCKDEDVKSLQEIMSNTRPCPKCATRIFRISGCSQMFCTHCHTGFDWNTGRIITSNFHNPHRMEWLRNRGMNAVAGGDDECAQFDVKFLVNNELLFRLYQRNHINDMLQKLREKIVDIRSGKLYFIELCKYVSNMIPKEDLDDFIKKHELLKLKNQMLIGIYQTFVDNVSDILMNAKYYNEIDDNKLRVKNRPLALHSFVEGNGLLDYVKENVSLPSTEFRNLFEEICDTDGLFVPENFEKHAMITSLTDNREIVADFHSYDNELKLINEIIERCNFLLYRYSYMFKLTKYQEIAVNMNKENEYIIDKSMKGRR